MLESESPEPADSVRQAGKGRPTPKRSEVERARRQPYTAPPADKKAAAAQQRERRKTEQMKARAGAIDELMASGALTDQLGGPPPDDIQAELDRMGSSQGVDAELERMKAELATGGAPKQIAGSAGQADSQASQQGGVNYQKEPPSGGAG